MATTVSLNDVKKAHERIKNYVEKTPVKEIEKGIYLKLDNKQPVVSGFKVRGAASAMTVLPKGSQVMTSALGTHGFAVGYMGKKLDMHTNCMMITNPPKDAEDKMKSLVSEVSYGKETFADTEKNAIKVAKNKGITFVHPYNDPLVIAGQGTIGLEIAEQVSKINTIYVPVGGGGLISGIATVFKELNPNVTIVGVQPQAMNAMHTAVKNKRVTVVETKKSVAEKLAVNLNPETITFEIVSNKVDRFVLPTEEEIKEAIKEIYIKTGERVEGAGAIAYAAAKKDALRGKVSVCIVSGGNISKENFEKYTGLKKKQ